MAWALHLSIGKIKGMTMMTSNDRAGDDPAVQWLLNEAAGAWQEPDRAAGLLQEAMLRAPDDLEVFVAAYRFHFYAHRLEEASAIALESLARMARTLDLPTDWRQVCNATEPAAWVDWGSEENPQRRFYLFALKAWGYLQLRLGRYEAGRAALDGVLRLDPRDRVGSGLLLGVLDRPEEAWED